MTNYFCCHSTSTHKLLNNVLHWQICQLCDKPFFYTDSQITHFVLFLTHKISFRNCFQVSLLQQHQSTFFIPRHHCYNTENTIKLCLYLYTLFACLLVHILMIRCGTNTCFFLNIAFFIRFSDKSETFIY